MTVNSFFVKKIHFLFCAKFTKTNEKVCKYFSLKKQKKFEKLLQFSK